MRANGVSGKQRGPGCLTPVFLAVIVNHEHLMSERFKIEIASNTSPVFFPHFYLGIKEKIVLMMSCSGWGGGRKSKHLPCSFLCVSFILNEQQASKMMALSGVPLGQVEPAYRALFSPMLLQEMNALY